MLANQRSDAVRCQDLEAAKCYKGRGGSLQWAIDLSLFLNLHHAARGARRKGKGAGDVLGTVAIRFVNVTSSTHQPTSVSWTNDEPFRTRHDVLQLRTALIDPGGALDGWV